MPSKPSISRTCQRCGATFLAYKKQIERGWGKFCSRACTSNPKPAERPCEHCNKMFRPKSQQLRDGQGRFCSHSCASRHRWKGHTSKPREPRPKVMRRNPAERLWSRVHKTKSCWIWTGLSVGFGYGTFKVNGKSVKTHDYSYELHYGPIPKGLYVLHKCGNHSCVNPGHLFLGTRKDISAARAIKESNLTFLTKEQVREIRQLYTDDGAKINKQKEKNRKKYAARVAAGLPLSFPKRRTRIEDANYMYFVEPAAPLPSGKERESGSCQY